ncbi:UDP-glucose dehydrogenase family protein [Clostridium akagii]|uniref:UDP-glucose dehydrogenase family protein n=1 Tax=Clostridium akagii TaxID=91623 RepID=UPI00047A82D9|nr:UDP-glucose/GDP-mannose dehydrogenase family protein [Clostridium akagii]
MSKRIAVVGTGYVGLIAAIGFSDFGNQVIGVDIDKEKIDNLNKGISPIYEQGVYDYLDRNLKSKRLRFSSNIDESMRQSEVIFIGVGTPPKGDGEADLSQVKSVVKTICKNLNGYKVIVLKSTVPIGTNRWVRDYIKKETNSDNFDVVSNPEFLREGKAITDFFHPDRVVVGYESEKSKEIIKDIYRSLYLIETPFVWCNYETAELIKYANNAYLATKITFINQIANLSETIGADVKLVAKAMGMDGRINSKFLHPGAGYGGSCFPKDTNALAKIGDNYGVDMSLVKEVIHSNELQKTRMVKKLQGLTGDLNNKCIAVLGLSFKPETDDMRESPAISIIKDLIKNNSVIKVHDPKAMDNAKKIFGEKLIYCDTALDTVKNADALILVTDWNEYRSLDLNTVGNLMKNKIILDTRNMLEPEDAKSLGFIYEGVGRK